MDNKNSNAIQSDQQNPQRDSAGETSLAKLTIEEDRGANRQAVSTLNSSMDTITEDNLLQQSDVGGNNSNLHSETRPDSFCKTKAQAFGSS